MLGRPSPTWYLKDLHGRLLLIQQAFSPAYPMRPDVLVRLDCSSLEGLERAHLEGIGGGGGGGGV